MIRKPLLNFYYEDKTFSKQVKTDFFTTVCVEHISCQIFPVKNNELYCCLQTIIPYRIISSIKH